MAYLTKATKNLTAQLRLKGGVAARTLTGAVTCDAGTETFCSWDPGGASRDVTLTAEESSNGLFHVFVNEADAAENLVIKNDAGSTVCTIGQGEWAMVACTGTAWFDVPFSALSDYLASANTWTGVQTFSGVRMGTAGVTAITTTRAVTAADGGGIFTVAQSSAYTVTVAAPTAAGVRYTFQCVSPGAFDVSLVATGCTFEGTIVIDAATIPATGSTLKFASGAAVLGDTIELISTSASKFCVRAVSSGAGGITIT
jgi:hypothetical protein